MMDKIDKERRSWNMSRIKSKNTKPEFAVKHCLEQMGLNPEIQVGELPGTPDFVLRKEKTAILVNGCFWHHHKGCRFAYLPKSHRIFWRSKLLGNVKRDKRVMSELRNLGWTPMIVWECVALDSERLRAQLRVLLRKGRRRADESLFSASRSRL